MSTRFMYIEDINFNDYVEADVAAIKLEDDVVKLCTNDEGHYFLVYLVKSDEENSIEWVEIFETYDSALNLAEKLNCRICGENVAI